MSEITRGHRVTFQLPHSPSKHSLSLTHTNVLTCPSTPTSQQRLGRFVRAIILLEGGVSPW